MTLHHNRSPAHRRRQLKARQDKIESFFSSVFSPDPTTTETTPTSTNDPNNNQPSVVTTSTTQGHQNNFSTSTTVEPPASTTFTTSTRQRTTATSTTEQPEITSTSTSTTESTSTSTSTTSSSSSSSSTSTSTSTSTTTSKSTSVAPVTLTAAAVTQTESSAATFTSAGIALTSSTPSTTAVATGGLSTGAIVGSVAGGIAGIVAICMIIAFFLRRWRRNRVIDDDFSPENFAQPNMTQTRSGFNDNPFEPTPPPNAAFRGSIAPSIASGPNMAGQGAYAYGNEAPYSDVTYSAESTAAYGASAGTAYGATGSGGGLQERQAYTYGVYEPTSDDAINGAYSSEPQPQNSYNPEAYGSYAYSTDAPAVIQPSQQFHPYSSQEYQAHYQDNATPALVAGAPSVAAGRATPSIIDNEDAYGGI